VEKGRSRQSWLDPGRQPASGQLSPRPQRCEEVVVQLSISDGKGENQPPSRAGPYTRQLAVLRILGLLDAGGSSILDLPG
jgi:hypothetical protein